MHFLNVCRATDFILIFSMIFGCMHRRIMESERKDEVLLLTSVKVTHLMSDHKFWVLVRVDVTEKTYSRIKAKVERQTVKCQFAKTS